MDANAIFRFLDENNFLTKLVQLQNILLIGDMATLEAFQIALDGKSPKNEFYYLPIINESIPAIDKNIPLASLSSVIVASLDDEELLFQKVSQEFASLVPVTTPILKLFSDVFVNFLIGTNLLKTPSQYLVAPQISYAIVTTPRSGSTFLCSLLQSTKLCGEPSEHLRQASVSLARYCKFDYIQALRRLMDSKVSANGVFGTKFISHFLSAFEKAEFDFDGIFTRYFSKFIYLKRNDTVAQAVSVYLAQKTGTWHITGEDKRSEYASKLNEINLDDNLLEGVHKYYLQLKAEEEYLDNLINEQKISPLIVEYEELLKDPQKGVALILDFLGIAEEHVHIDGIKSITKTLRSELSEQIANSYRLKYLVPKQIGSVEKTKAETTVENLVAEGDVFSRQGEISKAAACFRRAYELDPSVPLSYQQRDIEVAEYKFFTLKDKSSNRRFSVRGDKFNLESGDYFSCIGQAFTRGRFVNTPYPSLLEKSLQSNCLNLGFAGVGSPFFTNPDNQWLIDLSNQGKFTIVLVMSGRSIESKICKGVPEITDVQASKIYSELYSNNPTEFEGVVLDLKERYVKNYLQLSEAITTPKILLWFAERNPEFKGEGFRNAFYNFPHFIDVDVVNRIRPFFDYYVECSTRRGLPQKLISRITGEPCKNSEGLAFNTYYASPEMHEDVTRLLLPICQRILNN